MSFFWYHTVITALWWCSRYIILIFCNNSNDTFGLIYKFFLYLCTLIKLIFSQHNSISKPIIPCLLFRWYTQKFESFEKLNIWKEILFKEHDSNFSSNYEHCSGYLQKWNFRTFPFHIRQQVWYCTQRKSQESPLYNSHYEKSYVWDKQP